MSRHDGERISRRGLTVKEVASMVGVSERTIIRWTSEPRDAYLARADKKRRRVLELREQGMSMRAIAAELGCSPGLVHHYVHGG